MGLYERIIGSEQPKISPHQILALFGEVARGQIAKAQAQAVLQLSPGEILEAETLFGTFTGTVSNKVLRAIEVHDVLLLAESRSAPYDTVAAVKSRLGV